MARRINIRYFRGVNVRTPAHLLEEGQLTALKNMESRTGALKKRSGLSVKDTVSPPADDYWTVTTASLELPRENIDINVQIGTTTNDQAGMIHD